MGKLTGTEAALLARIEALEIDPPGAALRFSDRLARENGWAGRHAARVVREYRRFLFLAASGQRAVTPSDAVDQAWHLHLAYTRSYWEDLCGTILGRPLHHGATAGGEAEDDRYREQYAATLAAYRAAFGEDAPGDIWPGVEERFAGRFERVDRSRSWVVPKVPLAPLAAAPLLAGCVALAANAAGSSGSAMAGYIMFGVMVAAIAAIAIQSARADPKRTDKKDNGCSGGGGCGTGDSGSSGCGSGCGGGGCGS